MGIRGAAEHLGVSKAMTAVTDDRETYLADFAAFEKGRRDPPAVRRLRQGAIERFAALGFPTTEDEEWRFTNLAPLARVPFRLAASRPAALTEADVQRLTFPDAGCHRLVFVNGRFAAELSTRRPLPDGVLLGSLAEALRSHGDKVEPHLARYADYEEQALTALNTAFFSDGAFLLLPRNTVVAEPVHLVFVSTAATDPTVSHPRNLVVAGVSSQVRLVESYVGLGDGVYFTTPSPRSRPARTRGSTTASSSAKAAGRSTSPPCTCTTTAVAPSPRSR